MLKKKINVILARAGWCGHCHDFEPIYKKTIENCSKDKVLNKYKISFDNYDLATNEGKTNFTVNHIDAVKIVEGYPTVLVNVNDNGNNKYHIISHTTIDENIKGEDRQHQDASERFLLNISNLIKSLESDSKILYMQTGGAMINSKTLLNEEIYRKKYLKYKSKYIELKK